MMLVCLIAFGPLISRGLCIKSPVNIAQCVLKAFALIFDYWFMILFVVSWFTDSSFASYTLVS